MNKRKKKGFTIVELVIVIAIIAILAAVLIPTFSNIIKKANRSSDTQLIRNLNTAVAIDLSERGLEKHSTMYDAIQACAEAGYLPDVIVAKSDYNIAWEQSTGHFVLLDMANEKVIFPTEQYNVAEYSVNSNGNKAEGYFVVTKSSQYVNGAFKAPYDKFSVYAYNDASWPKEITVTKGFDAGSVTTFTKISYTNSVNAQNVVIRTNGGSLTINDTNAASHQIHYGTLYNADVTTGTSCFSTHGTIYSMKLNAGKAISDENGMVILVEAEKETEIYEQNGGVVIIPSDKTTSDIKADADSKLEKSLTTIGYTVTSTNTTSTAEKQNAVIEINNEEELKAFRDSVNNGITYAGVTVKLCSDITLTSAWTPIGVSGYREAFSKHKEGNPKNLYFAGTFDGNNKVISGLTSEGYVPLYKGTNNQYSYGLFGAVSNATIKNLTLDNVNISVKDGDSVGAIVGFSGGDLTISNCTVNGSVLGYDAVGGIVGRSYNNIKNALTTINLEANTNNARVSFVSNISEDGRKVAGVLGFASYFNNINVNNNVNTGDISINDDNSSGYIAGICLLGGSTNTPRSEEYNVSIKNNRNEGNIYGGCVSNAARIACTAGNTYYNSAIVTDNEESTGTISVQKYYYKNSDGNVTYLTYNFDIYPTVNLAQHLRGGANSFGFMEANDNEPLLDSTKKAIVMSESNMTSDAKDHVKFVSVLKTGISNGVASYNKKSKTLTLKKDVTFDCSYITIDSDITIDLNGHTITSNNTENYVFHLHGKINLKNGTIKMAYNKWALCVENNCTIEDVNIITNANEIVFYIYNGHTKVNNIVCTIKNSKINDTTIVDTNGRAFYFDNGLSAQFVVNN